MSYLGTGRPNPMCPECCWGKVAGRFEGGIKYSCGTLIKHGVTTEGRQCKQYQRENP